MFTCTSQQGTSLQPIHPQRRHIKTQLAIVSAGLIVKSGSSVPGLEWRPPLGMPRVEAVLPAGEGSVVWALPAEGPSWRLHRRLKVKASSSTGHLFYRKLNPGDQNLKGHQFCGQARTGQPFSPGASALGSSSPLKVGRGDSQLRMESPSASCFPRCGRSTYILSEVIQAEKDKYHRMSLTCRI